MERLPDELKQFMAKSLNMSDLQSLSLTDKSNRRVITKNFARKFSIKKKIKQYKEELKEHINDLNESINKKKSINDRNVRTLEELLVYDPDDVAQVIFQGEIVETNDAIERLQKKLKSIDADVVSKPSARRGWRSFDGRSLVNEGEKKYKKKKKTIKKKKKKRSKKKTKHK